MSKQSRNHLSESFTSAQGIDVIQSRIYLEAAKFNYQQMQTNLQDRTRFLYSLLAFLPIARSVTLVFQKQFGDREELMDWYQGKVKDWGGNIIMKFFKEMRNISLKEHAPRVQTIVSSVDCVIEAEVRIWRKPPIVEMKETKEKQDRTVGYSFDKFSGSYHGNPDVMYMCQKYLDELEKFVTEAENMVKRKVLSHE